jgi:hypothetical protein
VVALRSFIDSAGCAWDVWEVNARVDDRRKLADRRATKRSTFERRVGDLISWMLGRQKGHSWLVLRSVLGRWRFSPVPYDWERMSDAALHQLISQSVRAKDLHSAA